MGDVILSRLTYDSNTAPPTVDKALGPISGFYSEAEAFTIKLYKLGATFDLVTAGTGDVQSFRELEMRLRHISYAFVRLMILVISRAMLNCRLGYPLPSDNTTKTSPRNMRELFTQWRERYLPANKGDQEWITMLSDTNQRMLAKKKKGRVIITLEQVKKHLMMHKTNFVTNISGKRALENRDKVRDDIYDLMSGFRYLTVPETMHERPITSSVKGYYDQNTPHYKRLFVTGSHASHTSEARNFIDKGEWRACDRTIEFRDELTDGPSQHTLIGSLKAAIEYVQVPSDQPDEYEKDPINWPKNKPWGELNLFLLQPFFSKNFGRTVLNDIMQTEYSQDNIISGLPYLVKREDIDADKLAPALYYGETSASLLTPRCLKFACDDVESSLTKGMTVVETLQLNQLIDSEFGFEIDDMTFDDKAKLLRKVASNLFRTFGKNHVVVELLNGVAKKDMIDTLEEMLKFFFNQNNSAAVSSGPPAPAPPPPQPPQPPPPPNKTHDEIIEEIDQKLQKYRRF